MTHRMRNLAVIFLICSLAMGGCNLGAGGQAAEDPNVFYTEAAATMYSALTMNAVAEIANQPTDTPTPPPTDTPAPTDTPLPTEGPTDMPTNTVEVPTVGPTNTPVPENPMLHVTENTNCRAGPSPIYGVEGYVTTDMVLPVMGINEGHSWWWVRNPTYPDYNCWVWKYTSVVEGDTSEVPIYRDPWTMTPGEPELSISTTVYPSYYKGICPQEVTVVATIHSNRAVHIQYQWLRKGYAQKSGWATINADGSVTLVHKVSVRYSTEAYFNLKINYPIKYMSPKIHYETNCLAK
jgi:hypothetical protein